MRTEHYAEVLIEDIGDPTTNYKLAIIGSIWVNDSDPPEIKAKPVSVMFLEAHDWRCIDFPVEIKVDDPKRFIEWLWNADAKGEDVKDDSNRLRKRDRAKAMAQVLEDYIRWREERREEADELRQMTGSDAA